MASWQAHFLSFVLRHTFKRRLARTKDVHQARALMNSGKFRTSSDVRIVPETLGGVEGEWVEAASGVGGPILLYLHGGGYFACSARTHRPITTAFARHGFRVFAPDYSLAPEHPFPAAVTDSVAAYGALRGAANDSSPIVIAGDSAGGGLALAIMLRLRAEGIVLPAAAALFSPVTDLLGTGASRRTNNLRCAMFFGNGLPRAAGFYMGGADPREPLASPLYADLEGLPPLLIHVGAGETLLDDSTRLAQRAQEAGVTVDLTVWPAVPHAWQLFHGIVPEGRQSIAAAGAFLKNALATKRSPPEGTIPARVAGRATASGPKPDVEVLIVGSGFSGLCMAIHLRKAGMNDFMILEKAGDIGGTWRDNAYPGCACDIPSYLYSFSFERKNEWSRMYPTQWEIFNYLKLCVDKYALRPAIHLRSELREAVFDETLHLWRVSTLQGDTITARVLVSGTGGLSRPAYPILPGLENFRGKVFHSAEWDHAHDLRGKRVAVIGTGASSIQFVPQIAPTVESLYVFQRTAPWILPKLDRPIGGRERVVLRWVPGYMRLFREFLYWRQELLALGFTVNPKLMKRLEKFALNHLERNIPDPTLRKALTPSYTIGCKRILISNDYLPALTRDNVELVTDGIARFGEHTIVTQDGRERPIDTVILATGFRATDLPAPVRIIGCNGVDINDAWRNCAEAYFGITVAGFPNFFILVGPNTGLGHNSIVFMIEAQVHYVMKCLARMRETRSTLMNLRPEVQARFNRDLQEHMSRTVWVSGCKSWYQDARGKNTTLWPGFTFKYWMETRDVTSSDYTFAP